MSDFTYVNLILNKDIDIGKKYVNQGDFLFEHSHQFACLVTEKDNQFTNIDKKIFPENILALSEEAPVLFFAHPADHGFGYIILFNREQISSCYIDYGFEEDLPMNIALDLHSPFGIDHWMADTPKYEALALEKKDVYMANIFTKKNTENFKLFGISPETINELDELLTVRQFEKNMYAMAAKFMALLAIEDMEFIAWDYVVGHPENYPLIGM